MCEIKDGHNYSRDVRAEMNGSEGNGKQWEWFWRVLSVVAIPWAAWMSIMVVDVRERVAVIEGNRFNSRDAYDMMRLIDTKADKTDVPPSWFVEEVDEIKARLDKHIEIDK